MPESGGSAAEQLGAGVASSWVLPERVPAVLALSGLAAYVVLNVAAVIFYTPLGVSPREVGLGYTDLLAQSVLDMRKRRARRRVFAWTVITVSSGGFAATLIYIWTDSYAAHILW